MTLNRREILQLGLLGSGAFLAPFVPQKPADAAPFSPQISRFEVPLPIPPVLSPAYSDETTDYYEIKIQKARVEILPGTTTEIWGYNGLFPGPTIRQQGGNPNTEGRQSVVRFINELGKDEHDCDINAVIHLHGMASLPQYDGFATDFVPPGHFKDYIYPNDRAATIWYHDHAIDQTARNVYQGLAGMYIVEDEFERNLPLPKGQYDVPLLIRDAFFEQIGTEAKLVFDDRDRRSTYGDVALVNGVPWPRMAVANRKYRFRLLNISPSRGFQLALSRDLNRLTLGEKMVVIASDGGLLETPVELSTPYQKLKLGMAERYEIIIDFSQYEIGESVYLKNIGFSGSIDSDTRIHTLMRFDVMRDEPDDSVIPKKLREVKRLSVADADRTRTFRFERSFDQWLINGKGWNENRVDANPGLGDIEIWEFVNPGSGWFHPIHVHLIDMQMLDRNGMPVRPYEQGWKDVFHLGEFEKVRVIGEFGPRNPEFMKRFIHGKFMMHCHNLVHEDHSMMTVFEVGDNGDEPKSAPAQSITEMKSFEATYPSPPDVYDMAAIEEFDEELYGKGR
ncbi:MAG: multicopper oxidase family protein [Leptolyngbya sp. SIOISBB]|nr:multicopper oxidase family protein [Leptolyngbya sp. SIOISBB]